MVLPGCVGGSSSSFGLRLFRLRQWCGTRRKSCAFDLCYGWARLNPELPVYIECGILFQFSVIGGENLVGVRGHLNWTSQSLWKFFGGAGKRNRCFHHLTQAAERGNVSFPKSVRLTGEKLEDAHDFVIMDDRHHHDRGDSDLPTDFTIDAGVPLGIIAPQWLARTDAFPGKSEFGGEERT